MDNPTSIPQEEMVREIYEHFFKGVIKKQAAGFYRAFKIKNIIPALEQYYINMEYYRRTNDITKFCLSLFQQLECLVNLLCEKDTKFQTFIYSSFETKAYQFSSRDKGAEKATKKYYYLKDLLFPIINIDEERRQKSIENQQQKMGKPFSNWSWIEKYRAILYYYVFGGQFIYNYSLFNIYIQPIKLIKVTRDSIHGGITFSDTQRKDIAIVQSDSGRYFMHFSGFLEKFIYDISDSAKLSSR